MSAATDRLSPAAARPRLRLGFLDGIRGLAALYVLIFHALTISVPQDDQALSAPMRALRSVFGYGHFAVCVFIVLSGFSLMLPLARNGTMTLPGGFSPYLRRRMRRLLPPYYAALALSLVAVVAATRVPGGATDQSYDAALSPGSITSHVFLVHNWNFDWVYRINGPMWSVATEWQIYFLFPLLLLPLWRRVGGAVTVAAVWVAAITLDMVLPADQDLAWAAPWFVGSFALGMWGALSGFSGSDPARRLRSLRWEWVALVSLAAVVVVVAVDARWQPSIVDGMVSVFALAWILACLPGTQHERPATSWMRQTLGSRPLVVLGGFSYSLYLLQHPLLRLNERVLGDLPFSYEQILWIQLFIGVPFVMAAAWLFAEFFELPFTSGGHVVPYLRRRRTALRTHPGMVAVPTSAEVSAVGPQSTGAP
jgi:peptidoglycan/LPS O-acetylase OafA/YrhL